MFHINITLSKGNLYNVFRARMFPLRSGVEFSPCCRCSQFWILEHFGFQTLGLLHVTFLRSLMSELSADGDVTSCHSISSAFAMIAVASAGP